MWGTLSVMALGMVMHGPPDAITESPSGPYESLLKEYEAGQKAWSDRYEHDGQRTPEDKFRARYQDWPVWSFLPRFLKLAEDHSGDVAADSLYWVVDQGRDIGFLGLCDQGYYPHLERALKLLVRRDLLEDKRLSQALRNILRHPSPATEEFLRTAPEKIKNRNLRGRAFLALGVLLFGKAKSVGAPWFERPTRSSFEVMLTGRLHPGVARYLRGADRESSMAEGERVLEFVIEEYGDILYASRRIPSGRDITLADFARNKLDAIRGLAIGQVAPEIGGQDVDGRPMKLSDYRGKVVVGGTFLCTLVRRNPGDGIRFHANTV